MSEHRHEGVDPEVPAKAQRRRFTAEYKANILRQADACEPGTGELGALLRREGLYASHLSNWRAQRKEGGLEALKAVKGAFHLTRGAAGT